MTMLESFWCALQGMTNADWAAWVQAIGTILAIGAAAWIASQEHRRDKAREAEAEQRKAEQVAKLCNVFASQLLATVAELRRGCEFENFDMISKDAHRLDAVVHFGESIDPSAIPAAAVFAFLELRTLAAEAVLESVDPGVMTWTVRADQFEKIRERVHERAVTVQLRKASRKASALLSPR